MSGLVDPSMANSGMLGLYNNPIVSGGMMALSMVSSLAMPVMMFSGLKMMRTMQQESAGASSAKQLVDGGGNILRSEGSAVASSGRQILGTVGKIAAPIAVAAGAVYGGKNVIEGNPLQAAIGLGGAGATAGYMGWAGAAAGSGAAGAAAVGLPVAGVAVGAAMVVDGYKRGNGWGIAESAAGGAIAVAAGVALYGAIAGSAVGPIGTVIGAAVGGLIGLGIGLLGKNNKESSDNNQLSDLKSQFNKKAAVMKPKLQELAARQGDLDKLQGNNNNSQFAEITNLAKQLSGNQSPNYSEGMFDDFKKQVEKLPPDQQIAAYQKGLTMMPGIQDHVEKESKRLTGAIDQAGKAQSWMIAQNQQMNLQLSQMFKNVMGMQSLSNFSSAVPVYSAFTQP